MNREDDPYKIVQKVQDNAYKIELPSDINISSTFNVGDLAPNIEEKYEGYKNLRVNPLQEGEVDAEQFKQSNLLIHIKPLVRIRPMVTIE